MFKNWKTTLAGIGTILAVLGNAITEYTGGGFASVNISVLLAGVATGLGLLLGKDFNVSGVGANATVGPTPPVKP